MMAQYIDKSALVAEIKELSSAIKIQLEHKKGDAFWIAQKLLLERLKGKINSLEVKEVDIDKLCEFRKNIGFAYPEGASEYQKQLACYRQGIKDAIKAQKGE